MSDVSDKMHDVVKRYDPQISDAIEGLKDTLINPDLDEEKLFAAVRNWTALVGRLRQEGVALTIESFEYRLAEITWASIEIDRKNGNVSCSSDSSIAEARKAKNIIEFDASKKRK